MIDTHKYSVYGDRYDADATDDLDFFMSGCRETFMMEGLLRMIVEPGDGTRYEFLLIDNIELGLCVLTYLSDCGRSFAVKLAKDGFTVPSYLIEHAGRDTNPCTAAVACDLVNGIRNVEGLEHWFYDWTRGELIGVQA